MRRCSRCVMPETVPGLRFVDGVCACPELQQGEVSRQGGTPASGLGVQAEERGVRLHCAHQRREGQQLRDVARVVLGMKALAVNYDNEFQTEQARVNVERACERLGVDLVRVGSRAGHCQADRAKPHLRLRRAGPSPVVEGLCTACAYGYTSAVTGLRSGIVCLSSSGASHRGK